MVPEVGYTYTVTHPRAGRFVGKVEKVDIQHVNQGRYGEEDYKWVTLRVIEGIARRLATKAPVTTGETIELLTATTTFTRPRKGE